ncbi:hypothetical protein GLOTRDRAFT_107716 [Gloeophyllum trabeum ATCC 11539]|uniref:Mug135-like C-terminal domain-containing protein n=1 Tax=Gloeophyllum trabeum (strain ATCC 11539 / FP-39264 / Madison 617) TaxID=670483 RepID=S7PX22_GLOTA|nr:uncharacterized protein GLOTRDRAFT_107716 [Gloeophyllum trabeum ATCC 11539]EPQ52161.1 hypothetical protein GLOTRDRAFT_107716 [Gloeophyllum trabeum ATCC 11539]
MAIQPPVIQTGYDIPTQRQDVSGSQDAANAGLHAHRAELASAMGGTAAPSVDAVADAHKSNSVTPANAAEAAPPPWFHTAMRDFQTAMREELHTAMREVADRLGRLEDRLGGMEGRVGEIEDRLIATEISVKIAENTKRGEGTYIAVPNARGEYPVSQGLTALTHVDQIKALSTAEADRYIAFYSRPGQQATAHSLEGKQQFIAHAVGCTVPLFVAT